MLKFRQRLQNTQKNRNILTDTQPGVHMYQLPASCRSYTSNTEHDDAFTEDAEWPGKMKPPATSDEGALQKQVKLRTRVTILKFYVEF
jgi:hypothetical protein